MSKKHNYTKPQRRWRLKKTTGKREFVNVIYMDKEIIDGKVQVYAVCTCEKWRSSPEATTINAIGREAKEHVNQSGGKCRLRPHDLSQPPQYEILGEIPEEELTDGN